MTPRTDPTEPRTSSGATIMLDDVALAALYAEGAIVTIADLDLRPIRLVIRAEAAQRAAPAVAECINCGYPGQAAQESSPRADWSNYKPDAEEEAWMNAPMGAAPQDERRYCVHDELPGDCRICSEVGDMMP